MSFPAPNAMASPYGSRWREALLGLLLVAATGIAYLPALHAGYVWDDDLHLLNNPVLQPGGLARIWVPGTYINYWPLTFTTYWLENALWGVAHPMGFHLVNILLHASCALLVWRVLLRVRLPGWGALLGAAIFALHPVNVESVAWVAQLKNVLSLFLTLLATWLYLRQEDTGERGMYAVAVGAFALSTLAKGMGVTLPAVLLALAWWQRGRIDWRDVRRVLPFLVIGAVMACVEVAMQKEGQPWEIPRTDSPLARLAGAGWCVEFYFYKLIWPLNLSFVYPRWTIDGGKLRSFVPDVSLLCATVVAWWQRSRWGRGPFMVLCCYVALLLPVLGFANIYFMRYSLVADHWQYAAMIAPAAGMGALLAAPARRGIPRSAVTAVSLALLGCLGALTYRQAGVYHDFETLWEAVLSRNPGAWLPHHSLGNWLANQGRDQEAAEHYQAAVRLNPDDFQAYNNLGLMLSHLGQDDDASANFERALAINPDYALARQNLVSQYKRRGRPLLGSDDDEARRYYLRVTQLAPADAEAHYGLGLALLDLNEVAQAVDELQQAVTLRPDLDEPHDALARILATRAPSDGGDPNRALREAERACALTAYRDGRRLDTLGLAYASAGRFAEAVTTEEKALQRIGAIASPDVVAQLQTHLTLFRAGKPYRAPVRPAR